MTAATAPYRSQAPVGSDGFAQLLWAEWTKFRTVRGWVIGLVAAALVMVLLSLLGAAGSHSTIGNNRVGHGFVPVGPGGESVADSFYFVHQPLAGNGSMTLRVTSLTGASTPGGPGCQPVPGSPRQAPAGNRSTGPDGSPARNQHGIQPWAKAGIIIKASTAEGSVYAAVMVTGGHGVRMQYDYTNDIAGSPGPVSAASPRWLRLTRSGDILTGFESADDTHWRKLGTVQLAGLPSTVQAGLFVTSPETTRQVSQQLGGGTSAMSPSTATAVFDHVSLEGQRPDVAWKGDAIGAGAKDGYPTKPGGFQRAGGTLTVTGSGDIAPAALGGPGGVGQPIETSVVGAFAGLIVLIVLATLYITSEYRRGLIRTTLTASARRGRVLAAKAIVIGSVSLAVGLVGAAVAVTVGGSLLRSNGNLIYPVSELTELRVVIGTAALLAVTTVLALAVGTVLRRSAGTIAGVIVVVVLPYSLATADVLPAGPAQWLLRVTPAAAFAIQQTLLQYPQVDHLYTPAHGYYPLPPWAGFAVLCAYAALALSLAVFLLRKRDA